MEKILSGLLMCGAWGCFDEFNRLDEATLSTVSMYIHPIQEAIKNGHSYIIFQNQEVTEYM